MNGVIGKPFCLKHLNKSEKPYLAVAVALAAWYNILRIVVRSSCLDWKDVHRAYLAFFDWRCKYVFKRMEKTLHILTGVFHEIRDGNLDLGLPMTERMNFSRYMRIFMGWWHV